MLQQATCTCFRQHVAGRCLRLWYLQHTPPQEALAIINMHTGSTSSCSQHHPLTLSPAPSQATGELLLTELHRSGAPQHWLRAAGCSTTAMLEAMRLVCAVLVSCCPNDLLLAGHAMPFWWNQASPALTVASCKVWVAAAKQAVEEYRQAAVAAASSECPGAGAVQGVAIQTCQALGSLLAGRVRALEASRSSSSSSSSSHTPRVASTIDQLCATVVLADAELRALYARLLLHKLCPQALGQDQLELAGGLQIVLYNAVAICKMLQLEQPQRALLRDEDTAAALLVALCRELRQGKVRGLSCSRMLVQQGMDML